MRRRVIVAGVAVAVVAAGLWLSPWREALGALAAWARDAGVAGPATFAAAYVTGSVLALPVWPLTVVAGVAYGAVVGFAVALPCGTVGATVAFLAGRTLFRGVVARRLARDPRLVAMDEAVSRRGALLVFLLRLSPLAPYNVVNYALAASRIRTVPFAAASFLGMAPITFAWAWAGATFGGLKGLSGRPPPGPVEQGLRWAGLAATVAVVIVLGRMAKALAAPPAQ